MRNRTISSNSTRAIRIAVATAGFVASWGWSNTSHAFPVALTQAQFNTAAGGSAVVEDFEGFSTGIKPNPFVFVNGRLTEGSLNSPVVGGGFGPTNTLFTQTIDQVRTFDLFPLGTTLVGMNLFYIQSSNLLDITVTGGSGTLNISQTGSILGTFLGFQDLLGIASITFLNQGTMFGAGNYSFDNFQTVSAASVPEPAGVVLFGLTVLGMAVAARRGRKNVPHGTTPVSSGGGAS